MGGGGFICFHLKDVDEGSSLASHLKLKQGHEVHSSPCGVFATMIFLMSLSAPPPPPHPPAPRPSDTKTVTLVWKLPDDTY